MGWELLCRGQAGLYETAHIESVNSMMRLINLVDTLANKGVAEVMERRDGDCERANDLLLFLPDDKIRQP